MMNDGRGVCRMPRGQAEGFIGGKEILEWSLFEGRLGLPIIDNNYILFFKLMISVGISLRI